MAQGKNKIEIIDRGHDVPVYSSVCSYCKHLVVGGRTCQAFPEGIPMSIWMGQNKHTSPVAGDEGLTFEKAGVDK